MKEKHLVFTVHSKFVKFQGANWNGSEPYDGTVIGLAITIDNMLRICQPETHEIIFDVL